MQAHNLEVTYLHPILLREKVVVLLLYKEENNNYEASRCAIAIIFNPILFIIRNGSNNQEYSNFL